MTLATDLDVAVDPDVVTFTVTVRNDGSTPVDLQFRSAKHADVAVLDDGEEVWRWSDGRMFAQMIQPVHIEPGHTESYEFEWRDPPAGEYEAVATLNAMDGLEARDTVRVA